MNKRISAKKIYIIFFISNFILTIIFIYLLIKLNFSIVFLLFPLCYFILSLIFLYNIRNKVIYFAEDISELLDDLMDEEKKVIVEENKENLYSKIVHKINKVFIIYQEKLDTTNRETEQIQKMLSDIAHQIKTPMTNIKMYHEILIKHFEIKNSDIELINIIKSQINKLDFLLQGILKISQLETGIITINKEIIPIKSIISKSLENILLMAQKKNIYIQVEDKGNITAYCDLKWASEALFNILDNAVKYTGENGRIKIVTEKTEIYTCIKVIDNGIGIKEENLLRIFERFYREKKEKDYEGVGIGLNLAREIILKHKGYITVNSIWGQGSEFNIYLPCNSFITGD